MERTIPPNIVQNVIWFALSTLPPPGARIDVINGLNEMSELRAKGSNYPSRRCSPDLFKWRRK
jgi:hypothetical protein